MYQIPGCDGRDEGKTQWQWDEGNTNMCSEVLRHLAKPVRPIPTQPNPTQFNPTQPRPTLGTNEPTQRGLYSFCFPSIRYTQGKQEGIRMGPDRHLVCWEISLGWSERLPSPLPAPAHQMWGEGHIASSLCSVVCMRCVLSVFLTLDGTDIFRSMSHLCVWEHIHLYTSIGIRNNTSSRIEDINHTAESHLCSSPPSPLLLSTILHRSEATSSFCWLVRLRLGMWSWHGLLSERLNSRYGTKACWSSSQYSRLQGTWEKNTRLLRHKTCFYVIG